MSIKQIILIGCGNIGSRHLQAIAKLPYEINIEIIDTDKEAQKIAKSRLEEIDYSKNKIHCNWLEDLKQVRGKADLVIVATNSTNRYSLISQLLDMGHSRFLIEKIVTQSSEDYNQLLDKAKKHNANIWIDSSKVYFSAYQKIKKLFVNDGPIHLSVNSGNWGLGTAAIHWINLLCFFCDDYEVKLNGDALYNEIFPNKRGTEFVEFAGIIIALLKDGSSLTINFSPHDNLAFTVEITGKDKHLLIDETHERMYLLKGQELDFDYKFEFQSDLTTKILTDIFEKDNCLLPTIQDSSQVHHELFRIFNAHIKKIRNKDVEKCPIT